MKHHKDIRKFNRPADQRVALFRSLARSLIDKERIETTEAKAKSLRPIVERFITYGKRGTLTDRRRLAQEVGDDMAKKVVEELGVRYAERQGGYTRVIKTGPRMSDAAAMAYIELV